MKIKQTSFSRRRILFGFLFAVIAQAYIGCTKTNGPTFEHVATGRNPERWPQLQLQVQRSMQMEADIASLVDSMTVEQKVAQMIQPEIRDVTVEDMRRYGFGSYLNGGGAYPKNDKRALVADWVALADAMHQASLDDAIDGIAIPTMWGTDAVHGHNNVIGATIFPHNVGLGATHNPELITQIAAATAREVLATGIDWVFAPTVAVVRDDRWGRTYEGYSEDPQLVRAYAAKFVEGMQGAAGGDFLSSDHVIATVKHFVGDGGTTNGEDQGNNEGSEQELMRIHAQGYVAGLEAGAQTVMASFNSWQGEKIHGNHYMLTAVLKKRMGFDGLVVGDWNGHNQVVGCHNSSCPQAINAGLDIVMAPTSSWKSLFDNTVDQVHRGEISMIRVDDAVSRILRVKMRAGLFDKPRPSLRQLSGQTSVIGADSHRAIAREAVRQSLVLLKNKDNILPLSPKLRVFVTGDGANNIGKQSGGWTITWQGTNNVNADFPGATSIYAGIKATVESAGGQVELGSNAEYAVQPDVAVVVFGENPYAEGNGDLDNLEYQRGNKRDLALLRSLQAKGVPVVSLFISGRPLWVNPEINASDAFVVVWLPGSEGGAIADVIFSQPDSAIHYDFHGKLSYSWPRWVDQTMINRHDASYDPLLPYGFGLRYGDVNVLSDSLDEKASGIDTAAISKAVFFSAGISPSWHIQLQVADRSVTMTSNVVTLDDFRVRTADRNLQEDSLQLEWAGTAEGKMRFTTNIPVDLRAYGESSATLSVDVKRLTPVVSPLYVSFGGARVEITEPVQALSDQEWKTLSIDIRCFTRNDADLHLVNSVFGIETKGPLGLQMGEVVLKPFSVAAATITCNHN